MKNEIKDGLKSFKLHFEPIEFDRKHVHLLNHRERTSDKFHELRVRLLTFTKQVWAYR